MYTIVYLADVVKKDIPALDGAVKREIKRAIEERLRDNPVAFGKPLRYSLKGYRRLRVGDYRVVYRIDEEMVVIIAIKHRRDVYEG